MLVERRGGFHDLALSPSILAALERAAYLEPTPIQAALIPRALAGRDVIGQAQTGTGKTAAFLLPFLNTWRDTNAPGPEALVLAPTRELVVHIAVGTPGRVLDHLARGTLSFGRVRYVVLDEADRMLDIGFRPDIEKILR